MKPNRISWFCKHLEYTNPTLQNIASLSTLMLINVCSRASDSRGFNYGLQPGSSIVCPLRWSNFQSIFALVGSPLMMVMTCLSDRLSDDELRATVEFWPDSQWQAYLPLLHYCRVSGVRLMACGVPPEVCLTKLLNASSVSCSIHVAQCHASLLTKSLFSNSCSMSVSCTQFVFHIPAFYQLCNHLSSTDFSPWMERDLGVIHAGHHYNMATLKCLHNWCNIVISIVEDKKVPSEDGIDSHLCRGEWSLKNSSICVVFAV